MATLDGVFTALTTLVKEKYHYQESEPSKQEKEIAESVFKVLKEKLDQFHGTHFRLSSRHADTSSVSSTSLINSRNERNTSSEEDKDKSVLASGRTLFSSLLSRPVSRHHQQAGPNSPFYAGRTTFGGASGSRRLRLAASNPYNAAQRNPPAMRVQANRPASITDEHLSAAAKRILDSMEKSSAKSQTQTTFKRSRVEESSRSDHTALLKSVQIPQKTTVTTSSDLFKDHPFKFAPPVDRTVKTIVDNVEKPQPPKFPIVFNPAKEKTALTANPFSAPEVVLSERLAINNLLPASDFKFSVPIEKSSMSVKKKLPSPNEPFTTFSAPIEHCSISVLKRA
ncbi:hypothetical protein HDE_12407 [Halotydeus destructor]|nr:hypothetical protein HDE_12407 [Halotydeus destructor]